MKDPETKQEYDQEWVHGTEWRNDSGMYERPRLREGDSCRGNETGSDHEIENDHGRRSIETESNHRTTNDLHIQEEGAQDNF
jgi:hypothetical protein